MLTICWSPKGGSGVSVVAAALALACADGGEETLLVDLDGDQPGILGLGRSGVGVADWLASVEVPVDALTALEQPVGDRLRLLERGRADLTAPDPDRLGLLVGVLASSSRAVVVDAGGVVPRGWWRAADARVVVVVRPCYLATRRLIADGGLPPGAVLVVVEEGGRVLRAGDVASALDTPRVLRLAWDPAVARAVDAGLLAARMPRSIRRVAERLGSAVRDER